MSARAAAASRSPIHTYLTTGTPAQTEAKKAEIKNVINLMLSIIIYSLITGGLSYTLFEVTRKLREMLEVLGIPYDTMLESVFKIITVLLSSIISVVKPASIFSAGVVQTAGQTVFSTAGIAITAISGLAGPTINILSGFLSFANTSKIYLLAASLFSQGLNQTISSIYSVPGSCISGSVHMARQATSLCRAQLDKGLTGLNSAYLKVKMSCGIATKATVSAVQTPFSAVGAIAIRTTDKCLSSCSNTDSTLNYSIKELGDLLGDFIVDFFSSRVGGGLEILTLTLGKVIFNSVKVIAQSCVYPDEVFKLPLEAPLTQGEIMSRITDYKERVDKFDIAVSKFEEAEMLRMKEEQHKRFRMRPVRSQTPPATGAVGKFPKQRVPSRSLGPKRNFSMKNKKKTPPKNVTLAELRAQGNDIGNKMRKYTVEPFIPIDGGSRRHKKRKRSNSRTVKRHSRKTRRYKY